ASVEEVGRFEHCAGCFQTRQPMFGISERAEAQFAFRAQPLAGLANEREAGFQRGTVGAGLQCADATASRGAGGSEPQHFAQLVELENVLCRSRHFRQCFFICAAKKFAASSGVVAEWMRLPLASFQTRDSDEARGPSSTSRTRSRMGCQKLPTMATGLGAITDLFSISQTTASSTKVPVPPLQATKPSARRISSKRRSSQVFTRTSTSMKGLAWREKNAAVTP